MKNDLLTIGEVARMKNVGVKALRYYERIGILEPAYVDDRTGYRYYAMSQMPEIDVIAMCIELGIPLKDLREYQGAHGELQIEEVLGRGRALAVGKLRRAQATLMQIDGYLDDIAVQQACHASAPPFERAIGERRLLHVPWEGAAFDAKRYVEAVTELYDLAPRCNLVPLYFEGMARVPESCAKAGMQPGWHVVMEARPLPGEAADIESMALPAGAYRGARIEHDGFEHCFEAAFKRAEQPAYDDAVVLILDIWDSELRTGRYAVDLLSLGCPQR